METQTPPEQQAPVEQIQQPIQQPTPKINLPGFQQPKFMEALQLSNDLTNLKELEVNLPMMNKSIVMRPLEGIDDIYLKTLFVRSATFVASFNAVLFKQIKQDPNNPVFKDLGDFNKKVCEYDKRMLTFGLLAASYDRLPERTIKCPLCGKPHVYELNPHDMIQVDTIKKTWDKPTDYLNYEITKDLIKPTDTNKSYATITYRIPTEENKIEVYEMADRNNRQFDDNKSNVMTTMEVVISYIKNITFHNITPDGQEKVTTLDNLQLDIYPYVTASNLIMQDRIIKTAPIEELEEYQPHFYFNLQCPSATCNHKFIFNVHNVEDEFFRKALSLYR